MIAAAMVAASLALGQTGLVEFSATWCGPCKQMVPTVDSLIRAGHPIQKVDIDANKRAAAQFRVDRVPTFVMVVDGKEVSRVIGLTSKQRLEAMLAMGKRKR